MFFHHLRRYFQTWPSAWLSLALIGLAAFTLFVALQPGRPILKAAVLAWAVLP